MCAQFHGPIVVLSDHLGGTVPWQIIIKVDVPSASLYKAKQNITEREGRRPWKKNPWRWFFPAAFSCSIMLPSLHKQRERRGFLSPYYYVMMKKNAARGVPVMVWENTALIIFLNKTKRTETFSVQWPMMNLSREYPPPFPLFSILSYN